MKREIIFRGKYAEAHEWVYGHYYNNHDCGVNQDIIICFDEDRGTGKEYLINTKYLGQFVGMQDKNGKDIYEGDIIKVDDSVCGNPIDGYNDGVYVVEFVLPDCAFILVQTDKEGAINFNEVMIYEVIGNIHDNPELL